jgi:hypothetical protein
MPSSMSGGSYSVSIVLDRSYGTLLRDLLNTGPVWAVDSPANRDCAQQLWAEFPPVIIWMVSPSSRQRRIVLQNRY